MGARIGIDTGGTFIDLVLLDADGGLHFRKQLADATDLAGSVRRGLDGLARATGKSLRDLLAETGQIAHGTTLATNAILTRTGAPTALITTEGLRDALEMRRGVKEAVFDLHYVAPRPLVGREHRYGFTGRIAADGRELKRPGSAADLEPIAAAIAGAGIR
jgi:N-methylhydantoinase A